MLLLNGSPGGGLWFVERGVIAGDRDEDRELRRGGGTPRRVSAPQLWLTVERLPCL